MECPADFYFCRQQLVDENSLNDSSSKKSYSVRSSMVQRNNEKSAFDLLEEIQEEEEESKLDKYEEGNSYDINLDTSPQCNVI